MKKNYEFGKGFESGFKNGKIVNIITFSSMCLLNKKEVFALKNMRARDYV